MPTTTAPPSQRAPGKALIAGCAGFIGSWLTDKFLEAGWSVTGIDSLFSGSRRNLKAAAGPQPFTFLEGDILDRLDVESDLIVNLACPAAPPRYQSDPLYTFKTSVLGTMNLVALAGRTGARLVHTSTSEVYGDPEVHPQREDYNGSVNPIGPRACYDEGKRAAETFLFDSHRHSGLDVGVARIFNTYGPRMDPYDGRVVSNFLRQALLGEPLTIYGEGQQTRSFCYVSDTVEALWRLSVNEPAHLGPINIGNPAEITILELAETVKELVGDVTLIFEPLPADDPRRRKPDITRAAEQLDWAPKVPLREGLSHTLTYLDDLLSSGEFSAIRSPHAAKQVASAR
ncbi:MAG: UDP-glucuronic acid decarboxylase family protein [Pseudomonadota bacterium]